MYYEMITRVGSAKIHIDTIRRKERKEKSLLVIILDNFLMYLTAVLAIVILLYIMKYSLLLYITSLVLI